MNYNRLKDVINMKFMGNTEARHQLIEYVGKQEPQTTISKGEFSLCPVCESKLNPDYHTFYCGCCGQRVFYD